METEAARFEADRRRAIARYEKVVSEAKEKEDEMLEKMVLILNEKKAEIRRLKRKLELKGRISEGEEEEGEEVKREQKKDKRSEDNRNENDRNNMAHKEAKSMLSDTQIYEQDTDVDSDTSDHEGLASGDSIPTKRLRTGATSAPSTSLNPASDSRAPKATKSNSYVSNFLRDSSDDED